MAYKKNSGPSIEEVQLSLKRKNFHPVYFLWGKEDFFIEETIDLLIQEALETSERSFNLDVFYGSDADVRKVVAIARSYPLMAQRRVVVLREVEKLSDGEILFSYLEHPSPTTCFVLVSQKADFRLNFYKMLKAKSFAVEATRLEEADMPQWIIERFKLYGKKISVETAEFLHTLVGMSLRDTHNEIKKLLVFVGDKASIEIDDVRSVVGFSRQYNVFELQRAIARKDLKQALEIVERMIEAGEHPIGTVASLTNFFRKVWLLPEVMNKKLNDYELSKAVGVSYRNIGDYRIAASKYSSEQIKICFKALCDADESLKSSGDHKLVMTLMLYRMLRSEQEFDFSVKYG